MKDKKPGEDRLATMLKETGLDEPSEHFSGQLRRYITQRYKRDYALEYKREEWLGKLILAVLVLFNLLMLYYLGAFNVSPVFFIGMTAFILGGFVLIMMINSRRKLQNI